MSVGFIILIVTWAVTTAVLYFGWNFVTPWPLSWAQCGVLTAGVFLWKAADMIILWMYEASQGEHIEGKEKKT